jgi:uncharacterized protein (TIGR02246 family)
MRLISSVMFLVAVVESGASAQSKADEAAVLRLPVLFCDAWAKHDAGELARIVTDDVDFVTVGAVWLHGKRDFETYHRRLLEGRFKDAINTPLERAVRFLRRDLAVVHWNWSIEGDKSPDGTARPRRYGMMVMVAEKRGGRWLVTVAQNTNNTLGKVPELEGIETPIPVPGAP